MKQATVLLPALVLCACASGGSTSSSPPAAKPGPGPKPLPVGPRRGPGASDPLAGAKKKAQDGDVEGALADTRAALAKQPNLEEGYELLSALCEMNQDEACAKAAIEDGVAALPESADLRHAKGMLAMQAQDLETAVSELEQARTLSASKDAEILADLAYAYLFVDRLADAEMTAKAARALAPDAFAPAFVHGEALLRAKKAKEATEAFARAVKAAPSELVAKRRLAKAQNLSGEHEAALAGYHELMQAQPKDAGLKAEAAGVMINLSRPKEAVELLEQAIELDSSKRALFEFLLEAQKAAGDKKGAAKTKKKLDRWKGK